MEKLNRRSFLETAGIITGGVLLGNSLNLNAADGPGKNPMVKLSGHIWVYASKYPPNWDSTPVIEQAFSDFSYAGMDGLELMEVNLRHDDAVANLSSLAKKYRVPVTGTSYGGDLWDRTKHEFILKDTTDVAGKLRQLKGQTFGVSVGDAGRVKTEAELDAQAEILMKMIKICDQNDIVLNLHNHTYEVQNGMHDLKGTLSRIPDIKLGPDLNWLVRGGINPVEFIDTYGKQMVYMHLRDQTADGKWTETVGSGSMDFKAISNALKSLTIAAGQP
jgi:sugar phosphate isomerase/epimerase